MFKNEFHLALIIVAICSLLFIPACTCQTVGSRVETSCYGNLIPCANTTYDLGSPLRYWDGAYVANIYAGNIYGANITSSSGAAGNITGAGTTGYIPYWNSSTSLANSNAFYNSALGRVGINNAVPLYTLDVTGQIHATGDVSSDQDINATNDLNAGNNLEVTDDADIGGTTTTDILQVGTATPLFSLYSGSSFMSQLQVDGAGIFRSSPWSASILSFNSTATIPERSGTGTYDYTGGAYERLLTATAPIFVPSDETRPVMILIMSGVHVGAVGEVEHYISATQIQLTGENGFDTDLVGVTFGVLPTPTFGVAESGAVVHSTYGVNTFMFRSTNATSPYPFFIYTTDLGNDVSTVQVNVENNGYSNNNAVDINFVTGNMPADTRASILNIVADKSGATSSSNTTEIDFIDIQQLGVNSSQSHAIHVGQGFDQAMTVSGGSRVNPSYGYQVTAAGAVTDRVTGVAPDGTAFLDTSASDVQIFNAVNDYILLGSTGMFEAVPVYLTIGASHPINATYWYSTGAGTWATLVVSDTTNGFQNSGLMAFNAPAAWATTDRVTPAGAAITNGYYIKIVRTRGTITRVPTEDYFKLYTSSSTSDFSIRGNGTIKPVQMADASAPNDSIYYSTTSSVLVYKDSSGTVHQLY